MAAGDGLSDAEWAIWKPFFPPERGRVGQPVKVPTRLFLDAPLWMTGEGARWRALPERFGPWNTAWRRFARWRGQGVFEAASSAVAQRCCGKPAIAAAEREFRQPARRWASQPGSCG